MVKVAKSVKVRETKLMREVTCTLNDGQMESLERALAAAGNCCGVDDTAIQLDLICTQFSGEYGG